MINTCGAAHKSDTLLDAHLCLLLLSPLDSGFPLDTIKTRMQAYPTQYTGLGQAFSKVLRQERVAGFYRGVLPPLTSLTILNTVNFSTYSKCKELLAVDTASLAHGAVFEPKV